MSLTIPEFSKRVEERQRDGITRFELRYTQNKNGELFEMYIAYGGSMHKNFILKYVPELLTMIDDAELGHLWLSNTLYGVLNSLNFSTLEEVPVWSDRYVAVMIPHLLLYLIRLRMWGQQHNTESIELQISQQSKASMVMQERFEKTPLIDFMPLMRSKVGRSGETLLLQTLKEYVRFERKKISGYYYHDCMRMALLIRLTTERLCISEPLNRSDAPFIGSKEYKDLYYLIQNHNDRGFNLKGWNTGDVRDNSGRKQGHYYREIRDPRYRRFKQ